MVAPAPACLIPGGKMTDAALVHTVVSKFADHLPLYRQEHCAARQGFHVSRSTLVGHVAAVAHAVRPIYHAICNEVRAARYVHLDDTPIKMLSPGRGQTVTGRIWVYRSERETAFEFTESREGRHPAEFLRNYRGFVVADAYAGHNRLYGIDRATFICCWAHVRRNFSDIKDIYPFALRMVEEIQRLYLVEQDLRLVSDDERRRGREARSIPLLSRIHQLLTMAKISALPASDIGIAIDYALSRWPALIAYAQHGFLPIDNNPAENALRPWAIGRKNWLFVGSPEGGERAAIVTTLIENCRMQGLDPYAYLMDTIGELHRGCTEYRDLMPRVYAERRSDQSAFSQ
jgi:transposase